MDYTQMAVEYLLVYCTSHGLTTLGEPALPKTYQPIGDPLEQCSRSSDDSNPNCKPAMPGQITCVFLLLATCKYLLSLMIWYVYQVIATVVMIASARIKILAAANAQGHLDSQRVQLDQLIWKIRVAGSFRATTKNSLTIGSINEVKHELKRRDTLRASTAPPAPVRRVKSILAKLTSLPCFRGFTAYLYLAVPQWYLAQIIDLVLSGQPDGHKMGFGSTSIMLATVFGSGFAVWTHYTITKPSNKKIQAHFPKGKEVLIELWPITAFWAICDHLPLSIPLALSRQFGLKKYAFDATAWNGLTAQEQQTKIGEFGLVFLLYAIMTAVIAVPATMVLRRVYASMLSDEDLAIVPFHRGDSTRRHTYDQRSKIHQPGLTVSKAWATITWSQYFRVLYIYLQYFAINQLVQMMYWSANWKLHEVLEINAYASTKLPCSPVGMVIPVALRNLTLASIPLAHSEL